jgi:ketosteroid isomerase-like protein
VIAMTKTIAALSILGFTISTGCSPAPDAEQRRQEIIALHQSMIQAHWDKDAAALAAPTADDYVAVSSGEVVPMSATEVEAMLAPYLAETEFSHYEDFAEPIVGVSDDGSAAWSIVQVRVAGTRTGVDGVAHTFDTIWAWLSIYRRDGDGWKKITDVSTNRPYTNAG